MGILNNSIVGTILAMMLIYALLSILVSILLELWNQFKKTRSKNLKNAIKTMIDGQEGSSYAKAFYNNYMVEGQTKDAKDKPIDHISDDLFTEAFIDLLTKSSHTSTEDKTDKDASQKTTRLDLIKKGIEKITDNQPLKELLLSFCFKANGDYKEFEKYMKDWYNEFMERVSGWYKKAQRYKLFIAGLLVSVALNVDSIFLFNVISKNDTLRNELEKVAENVATGYSQLDSISKRDPDQLLKTAQKSIYQIIDSTKATREVVNTGKLDSLVLKFEVIAGQLDSIEQKKYSQTKEALALVSDLSIPIGWKKDRAPLSWKNGDIQKKSQSSTTEKSSVLKEYIDGRNSFTFPNVLLYLAGILISALSLSFGAPFWFEMLSKLVGLRKLAKGKTSTKTGGS